ncbi:putative plastid-lipid-associated protein 10, chloroplastic isoform X3 [Gossypium australe]|uniref:Putative plastid-lipid-associated protein 10, chloroplastic isoform X3 n=1 Tax=Gossypium australe TaxID=47621 RepID=A0A5B6W1G8_9ROSI|nr:putative plastid-lipid-associated protein 10, chloroplastic isoform X3 [Gossypium australe]
MELAFAASVYPTNVKRVIYEISPHSSKLVTNNKRSFHNKFLCSVAVAPNRNRVSEVSVEGYNMGAPLDMAVLDGTWRLQYTSAPDVVVLLEAAARLPFFQVGQIFQKFECRDQLRGGVIRNVVRWSIPNLLEEQEGATLVVSAKFDVVSVRNIYLQFEEVTSIKVQDINISEQLQALIAPALLPRSFLSLQSSNELMYFFSALMLRHNMY